MLAKQTATLDALSNGRLTLGVGLGGREDDYRAAQVSFHSRGKRLEQQLEQLMRLWFGRPVDEQTDPIGPESVQPGGPELLIGVFAPAAIGRLERWGDSYCTGVRAAKSNIRFFAAFFLSGAYVSHPPEAHMPHSTEKTNVSGSVSSLHTAKYSPLKTLSLYDLSDLILSPLPSPLIPFSLLP